jgi:hypothetical protein
MPASLTLSRYGRDLIDPQLFERLACRLATDHLFDRQYADRAVDQTLAFLAAYGTDPQTPRRPSAAVDLAWHTFLLFTRDYAHFCQTVARQFVHHVPDDSPSSDEANLTPNAATMAWIEQAGFHVDRELWTAASKCDPDRCSATGSDGNENNGTIIDDDD